MTNIKVNFDNIIGKIKPMHAVGQPPFLGTDCATFSYLKDANIPYARLHDVGGTYGGSKYVDIPNVFPNFDADENDPASYSFEYTDFLITNLMEYGCEPIYRLGVTIENDVLKGFAPRYINPPSDYEKWARVCEHIIRHYNEGWANGFHYNIKYWEIWNEPENGIWGDPELPANQMWTGTDEDYYRLYVTTAKHLRACFGNTIKIGGYSSSGLYTILEEPEKYGFREELYMSTKKQHHHMTDFFHEFFEYIKKGNAPIDFFSWHMYEDAERAGVVADALADMLAEHGYGDIETHLNEWNTAHTRATRGTSYAAASSAAMLMKMQNKKTDMLCFYDARIGTSVYGGMFNPMTYEPLCTYYPFLAFGEMYSLENQVECQLNEYRVYALAAANGDKKSLMIANTSGKDIDIETNVSGFDVYLIDENHFMTKEEMSSSSLKLLNNQTVYIKNF